MFPVPLPPWPVLGSLAGGLGAIGLAMTIRRYRGRPGVDWFLGVFAAQALWCLSYGIGLLVDDTALRTAFEVGTWIGICWTAIAFLGFALEYTGRGDVIRGRLFVSIVAFGVLSTALLVTNPFHGLFWTDLRIEPAFGATTVSYTFGPWAYLVVGCGSVFVASAVFLLVDTLLSYGPLYRRESAAVALSSLPPGLALAAWILELGPVPQLQLAPLMFVPHVVLDAYAFDRAEMFDRHPTTSRAAERTAIDDLADPIVALAPDGRVVRLNPAAERMVGVDEAAARDELLDDLLDATVRIVPDGPDAGGWDGTEAGFALVGADGNDGETVTVGVGPDRRTYAVSSSPLTEPGGTHVGFTVVCSDVTERERRRQQLEVLNRILRHNLRNDAGVVHGYGELLADRLDDPELHRMADAIERRAGALATLADKAGTVETLLSDVEPTTVDVSASVRDVLATFRGREDVREATIEFEHDTEGADDPGDVWSVRMRADALEAIVSNTVANAIDHHDGAGVERVDGAPWVRVRLDAVPDDDAVVLTVEDDGPGIPDHEIAAVESGRETALEHGSGLGLWIVEWAAAALGADVEYVPREPRGTRVTVRIPLPDAADRSRAAVVG